MKAFYKIKKAQSIIDPILGRDSVIGLIFQLFEGLRDQLEPGTKLKGFRTIKYVEEKLLEMFEGDDRNPYFEGVYMALYQYYHDQVQSEGTERGHQTYKMLIQCLEKCLNVQLQTYGKYHSSVFNTYSLLGEAYFRT